MNLQHILAFVQIIFQNFGNIDSGPFPGADAMNPNFGPIYPNGDATYPNHGINPNGEVMNSNVGPMNPNIDGMNSNIGPMNPNVDSINSNVGLINTNVDGMNSNVGAINQKRNYNAINQNFSHMNPNVDAMNANIDANNQNANAMNSYGNNRNINGDFRNEPNDVLNIHDDDMLWAPVEEAEAIVDRPVDPKLKYKSQNYRRKMYIAPTKKKSNKKKIKRRSRPIGGLGDNGSQGQITPIQPQSAVEEDPESNTNVNENAKENGNHNANGNENGNMQEFFKKNEGLFKEFLRNKKKDSEDHVPKQLLRQGQRATQLAALNHENFRLDINKRDLPNPFDLDLAPAKGGRIHVMRTKRRLCQRNVLVPEGPKYDTKGNIYLDAFVPIYNKTYPQTREPDFVLPRCCNCCKKSVLGCE